MMLSRVADSLYWIGRYCERAEHTARLMMVVLNASLEGEGDAGDLVAERAFRALGAGPLLARSGGTSEVQAVVLDRAVPESVFNAVALSRENARQVRDQVTSEMWTTLNELYFEIQLLSRNKAAFERRAYDQIVALVERLHAFKGAIEGTMLHGEGYTFLMLGRYIERAQLVGRLLDLHLREEVGSVGDYGWSQCLRMCCALEPFIRVKTADFRREQVADFLALDPDFPRSLRFCGERIATLVQRIGPNAGQELRADCERMAGRLRASLDFATLEDVTGQRGKVFIRDVGAQCMAINAEVLRAFIGNDVLTQPMTPQLSLGEAEHAL